MTKVINGIKFTEIADDNFEAKIGDSEYIVERTATSFGWHYNLYIDKVEICAGVSEHTLRKQVRTCSTNDLGTYIKPHETTKRAFKNELTKRHIAMMTKNKNASFNQIAQNIINSFEKDYRLYYCCLQNESLADSARKELTKIIQIIDDTIHVFENTNNKHFDNKLYISLAKQSKTNFVDALKENGYEG